MAKQEPTAAEQAEALYSDFRPKITRRFARIKVNCSAVLAFPARNAHPRLKATLLQISEGGCAVSIEGHIYVGEPCLVWITSGGHKYLGAQGKVVWMKSVYEGHEMTLVGIEFDKTIELTPDLLTLVGAKKD